MDGTERLQGQLRDAAQGEKREETEADHARNIAKVGVGLAAYHLGKLAFRKKRVRSGKLEGNPNIAAPNAPAPPTTSQGNSETVRIKTKETAHESSSVAYNRADSNRPDLSQIKAKETYTPRQTIGPESSSQKSIAKGAASPDHGMSRPMEQGRQKFVQGQQKKAALRKAEHDHRTSGMAPTRQQDGVSFHSRSTSTSFSSNRQQSAEKAVRETVSNSRHQIKEARLGTRAVEQTSRQAVKAAETPRQVIQTGTRSTNPAQAIVKARQRAVQAAGAARRTAATVDRPVIKAAASALRGAVSAIRTLVAPLAAGGGAVIAVVLVLCLAGALLLSPLGIFFSSEDNGGQTMSSVVREINQEYDARVETLKTGTPHDALSLSGSRAPWPEVLAVYAVKTTSDPTNGQEVVTMDVTKKGLLKQIFWDMNELSSFTSTVPGEGDDEEDTTTLHITVTAKTTSEMADVYGFNIEQRQQLAELLSDEYRELWSAVLYGIGTGSGEIVAVALSQMGNVGGQPYWSWYGFGSRVDWCAIFVSWCANECGYIDAGVIPKFAGCVQGSRWFKERGLWQDRSYTPNPGDIIFFDWDNPDGFSGPQDGLSDHVGIVEKVENGRVHTIEGNSGDKCCRRSYPVGYYEIYGYGQLCL